MSDYNLEGNIGVGRGQVGLSDFFTLTIPSTQLWINAGVNRPKNYFITPIGINDTVRLPPIGFNFNEATLGHSILMQNVGMINLMVNDSAGSLVRLILPQNCITFTAQTMPNTWIVTQYGGGAIRSASNVGVGGVGIFNAQVGSDLQFKNINAGSSKITVTNDSINKEVDIDLSETNININNLGNIPLIVSKGGTGVTTLAAGDVLVGDGTNPVVTTKAAPIGDFVGTTDAQVLTNKTITNITNTVAATHLRSLTTLINVSSATAPTAGQVLTASSDVAADWRPATSSSSTVSYSLVTMRTDAIMLTYATAAIFPWINSKYSLYTNGIILYRVIVPATKTLDIRLRDITNAVTLGSTSILSSSFGSFAVSNPTTDAQVELQIKYNVGAGSVPQLMAADWQSSASSAATYSLVTMRRDAIMLTYAVAALFTWINSKYLSYTNGIVFYRVIIPGAKTLDIRLQDTTNMITLGSVSILVSSFGSFAVSNPTTDAQVELQIKYNAGAGSYPQFMAAVLEFDT